MLSNKGFTLIEVMIVVAIIAIIAMIAVPLYQDSIRKARRSDGTGALTRLQLEQEKMRANCPFYADELGAESCAALATNTSIAVSTSSPEAYYTIAITEASASSIAYTATATAIGDQANDSAQGSSCSVLTLTVNAANPEGDRTPAVCW